jgi:hypothetical protein
MDTVRLSPSPSTLAGNSMFPLAWIDGDRIAEGYDG